MTEHRSQSFFVEKMLGLHWARRTVRRALCTTAYDSQSGMRIQTSASRVALHDLVAASSTNIHPQIFERLRAAGLSSLQQQAPPLGDIVQLKDGWVTSVPATATAAEITALTASGAGTVSFDLPFNAAADLERSIADGVRIAQALHGVQCRVNLIGAFAADEFELQHAAAKLCDAGADHLVLVDDGTCADLQPSASSDDVEYRCEVVLEALNWVDVVGTPMRLRLGVRGVPSETGDPLQPSVTRECLKLGFTKVDADLGGVLGPRTTHILAMIDEVNAEGEHLPHEVDAAVVADAAREL